MFANRAAVVALGLLVFLTGTFLALGLRPVSVATPTNVPAASPSPSADAAPIPTDPNALVPGRHFSAAFAVPFSFVAPAGWAGIDSRDAFLLRPAFDAPGTYARTVRLWMDPVALIDTCPLRPTPVASGLEVQLQVDAGVVESVSGLILWLRSHPALEVTAPHEVTVGGLSGQRVDIQVRPSYRGGCVPEQVQLFATSSGDDLWFPGWSGGDERNQLTLLAAPGDHVLALLVSSDGQEYRQFAAEAGAIINTFEFEP